MALLDCKVYVAGTEFNDGSDPALDADPVVLSGLSVIWGRPNTLDQPEPSTAKFTVIDPTATSESLTALVVGAPVDVESTGELYDPPVTGTFVDPNMTSLDHVFTNRGALTVVAGSGIDIRNTPDSTLPWTVEIAPSAPSDVADAWDGIPKTSAGQTWRAQLTMDLPRGVVVSVMPTAYTAPNAEPIRLSRYAQTVTTPPYTSQNLAFDFAVDIDGVWLGYEIQMTNTGLTWETFPATTTWADTLSMPV